MSLKGSGEADPTVVDRYGGGVGWIAYPDEAMQRASHAVVDDDGVWVLDPVDAEGVDDLLSEFGEVTGVVVLLDRHERDAAAVANRHDVPVYVPRWMSGVADAVDAPVERFDGELGSFAVEPVVDNPLWQEAALFDGETLVVPESLGTVPYFLAPGERLGVHPMRRALPPGTLRSYDPERILVGHGSGVLEEPEVALREAIDGARRRMLPLYAKQIRRVLPFG